MIGLALVAGLVLWSGRRLDEQECGQLGECLGNGLGAVLLVSLVAPLVVLVGMGVLRFPRRDLWVVPLVVVAPMFLWEPVEFLQSLWRFPGSGWVWVLAEVAVVLAGWLLVRRAATPVLARILPLALLAALLLSLVLVEQGQRRARNIAELEAVPVTLRLVDLGAGFEVVRSHAVGDEYVVVEYGGTVDGAFTMPDVSLVPAASGTACEAAGIARPLGFDADACNGDPFLTTTPGYTVVGLTRGDTVLLASFSPGSGLEASWVSEQLLAAPEVGPEGLVP